MFITTKCDSRDREGAEKELEAGLKSMKTDYVDLWQLHKVGISNSDLEAIFASGGAMEALVAAKKAGNAALLASPSTAIPT